MAKTKCFFRSIEDGDKVKFKQSSCLFTISVGQQTHEGEHIEATIDLINDSFDSYFMLVDDSLQRHTMAISREHEPSYYYELSIKEGDLWLERNKKYYQQLKNLKGIIRWDTWLYHPKFLQQKKLLKEMVDQDPSYKALFDISVNEFVTKCQYRITTDCSFDVARAKRLSFDFILEECTALCLWTELNCNYEVYPNTHNPAINGTRARWVLAYQPDLLQAVTLGFRNAKQLAPQRFLSLEETEKDKVS